jgi:integrase
LEPPTESLTVATMLNSFDDSRTARVEAGRMQQRSHNDYMEVAAVIADVLGPTRPVETIKPLDLEMLNTRLGARKDGSSRSPIGHNKRLSVAKSIFRYANRMLDSNVKYEEVLRSPEKQLIRKHKAKIGARMFEAHELRSMLKKADPHMTVVIYTGLFCGFGPSDIIGLTPDKIDGDYISSTRNKTGVQRCAYLPAVTRKAIAAIAADISLSSFCSSSFYSLCCH